MRTARARLVAFTLVAALAAGCVAEDSPDPTPSPTPSATATPAPTRTADVTPDPTPEPTPEPQLTLDLPDQRDERRIAFEVAHDLAAEAGGQIVVTVRYDEGPRIDELVLRWPTELGETLFLAPFVPSAERIRDGGPPLVQPWTKWVEGPGERGEPAGTTSLGYGPMDAGMTFEIPLFVTRNAPGPTAFDLQFLAGEALLVTVDGGPAATRLEVP